MSKPTQAEIDERIETTRLLTYRQMSQLFPDCEILVERCLLWPKSYIAVREQVTKSGGRGQKSSHPSMI